MARGGALLGRTTELAVLDEHVDDLLDRRGGVVLLAGEAGIGKTRMAAAVAERAARRGVSPVWGRCREDGGAPPFLPWIHVLRAAASFGDVDPDAVVGCWLEASPRDGRTALPHPTADPAGRFRLLDAAVALLRRCAADRPILAILDDLHRADDASLALLVHLVEEPAPVAVLVLAPYRDDAIAPEHPLTATIGRIAASPRVDALRLEGLCAADIARLVERQGGQATAEVVATVVERANGNPFFATEIGRLLRTGGSDPARAASALPATVREVIAQRLVALPLQTRRALEAAAVLGRDFGRLPLPAVLDASPVAVAAALQPAATARVVVSEDGRAYRFTHALVQAALYESLPVARRIALHRRAAAALSALTGGEDDDERVTDLAYHSDQAALDGDTTSARLHTRAAGRRARQRLAFGEAARWFRRAVELADRESPPPAELLDLLLEAADSELCAGEPATARALYERTAALARRRGDAQSFATSALGVGATVVTAGRVDWDLVALLEEGIASAFGQADHARLQSRLAIELYWHQGGDRSRAQSLEALQTAERACDDAVLGVALHSRQFTLRSPEDLAERIAIGERLVGLATDSSEAALAFQGAVWLAADVMRLGDMARFRSLVATLEESAEYSRLPLQRWYATVMSAHLASVEGSVEVALRLSDQAAALGRPIAGDIADAYRLGQRCVLDRERDGLAALVGPIADVVARLPYFVTLRGLAALAAATTRHHDAAAWEIERLSAARFGAVPRDALWVATIALLTEAAALSGSRHLGTLVELLGPHRGTHVVQGVPNCWGPVDRFLGRALVVLGDLDAADKHLASAAAMDEAIGATVTRARTTLDRARLAAARGDRGTTSALVGAVRATALQLRLPALHAEAAALVAATGGTMPSAAGPRLSAREREVLALLTSGATNRELADRLGISLNTVERHLANIYPKLEVRGRAEAAVHAVRAGLELVAPHGGLP